uniref:Ankyrin repeat and MYND domain containing 1 n=1 Tax=Oryzias sinensis TaxID=183150 RepID=A0A8C7XYD0_9TELE
MIGDKGGAQVDEERRPEVDVQEWSDESKYEGQFVNALKHGKGKYIWGNGECYEGFFYKDHRHGSGEYFWPSGHKFTGKFYLNRKEGYAVQAMHEYGRQDVGLWLGKHLFRFCTSVGKVFSLSDFPEYCFNIIWTKPNAILLICFLCQAVFHEDIFSNECFVFPPGIECYFADDDHLPLPPNQRRELNQHFFGELWDPKAHPYQSDYDRDLLASLSLEANMQAHTHKHRSVL